MRYIATLNGKTYTIDIEETPESLQVFLNGEPAAVDLRQVTAPSLLSMLKDGRSYEVFAEPTETGFEMVIGGERFMVDVADERSLRLAQVQKRDVERRGDMTIKSPMPGLVVEVNVQAGDAVKAGQRLLVLEAMKMENEIRSFADGTVKAVHVQKGYKVELGQTLVVIG